MNFGEIKQLHILDTTSQINKPENRFQQKFSESSLFIEFTQLKRNIKLATNKSKLMIVNIQMGIGNIFVH